MSRHIGYYTCPICGNSDIDTKSYSEGYFGTVEETINCNICNYYYEFCYGNYQEEFGKYAFYWGYTLYENSNKEHIFMKNLKKAKFMCRRNWRKGLRKRLKEKLDD
jgi:hypothetical protein